MAIKQLTVFLHFLFCPFFFLFVLLLRSGPTVGVVTAGSNAVDTDIVFAVTACHVFGKTHQCPFFSGIGHRLVTPCLRIKGEVGAVQSSHGADVDNIAFVLRDHIFQNSLR